MEVEVFRERSHLRSITYANAPRKERDSSLQVREQLHFFRNFPCSSSSKACRSCSCVFITIGPYHATGSSSGFPDTSRKRMPSSPACTINSSPRSNSTSERLSASEGGGAVSSQPTGSVGTSSGSEALQNFPAPANTYANACLVTSTGSVFRRPGGTLTS